MELTNIMSQGQQAPSRFIPIAKDLEQCSV